MFRLSQQFLFEAAHTLERPVPVDEYTKSMTLHGHTYSAEVVIEGNVGPSGMLELPSTRRKHGSIKVDLYLLRKELKQVKLKLDHAFLDDLLGRNCGTLENLCVYIACEVGRHLPVAEVAVWRQTGDKCVYRPEKGPQ